MSCNRFPGLIVFCGWFFNRLTLFPFCLKWLDLRDYLFSAQSTGARDIILFPETAEKNQCCFGLIWLFLMPSLVYFRLMMSTQLLFSIKEIWYFDIISSLCHTLTDTRQQEHPLLEEHNFICMTMHEIEREKWVHEFDICTKGVYSSFVTANNGWWFLATLMMKFWPIMTWR